MTVHQESLSIEQPASGTGEEAPELEYSEIRTDSLMMFGAAIGGAILGMLLTLLMLAIVNGGTLSFTGGARQLEAMQANLERINENVGAVSNNVDVVAERANALQTELITVEANLRDELAAQGMELDDIDQALAGLDTTQQQFDLFVGALGAALTDMETVASGESPAVAEPTAEVVVPAADNGDLPLPSVRSSADLGPNDVQVVIFTDANRDGLLEDGETNLVGVSIALLDTAGETVASGLTSEAGALFTELAPGEYQLVVDDALGYELLSQGTAALTLDAGGDEGIIIYIPVSSTAD